ISCVNNLKQIGLFTYIYTDDNDDFFPKLNGEIGNWVRYLQRYTIMNDPGADAMNAELERHSSYFYCPNSQLKPKNVGGVDLKGSCWNPGYGSFTAGPMQKTSSAGYTITNWKNSQTSNPSGSILICDSNDANDSTELTPYGHYYILCGSGKQWFGARHGEKVNAVHVDGSVSTYSGALLRSRLGAQHASLPINSDCIGD
ncbi:MAG: hypothetical protein J6S21_06535, partial [Victivallales bacterium]|nr:hypothetical protein [Victivallales bacterium]